jgi:GNAT superfamily N-acetyltransferase
MLEPVLTVTDDVDPAAQETIREGLRRFNLEQTGTSDRRALAVLATHPDTGEVLGGLLGRTSLGLLFIDVFFLSEELRGRGVGSRILRAAEDEGRRRGCSAAMLVTISFQAPAFYERHGYRLFGAIDCQPPGTRRLFMTRSLLDA